MISLHCNVKANHLSVKLQLRRCDKDVRVKLHPMDVNTTLRVWSERPAAANLRLNVSSLNPDEYVGCFLFTFPDLRPQDVPVDVGAEDRGSRKHNRVS